MNDLTIANAALTMTSREIAELAGKEHKHVMRDIRALQDQLGSMFWGSVQNWTHPQNGQTYEEFSLDKDTCLTLLLGYDAVARMKVVKRWQELEAKAAPALNLSDPAHLRSALLTYTEKVIELESKMAEQAPKVSAYERIAKETEGAVCGRLAAKLAQIPEKIFFRFSNAERFIFRHHHGNTWMGYADKVKAGFIEQKFTTVERDDGTTKVIEQVLFTPKGIAKLAELYQMRNAA